LRLRAASPTSPCRRSRCRRSRRDAHERAGREAALLVDPAEGLVLGRAQETVFLGLVRRGLEFGLEAVILVEVGCLPTSELVEVELVVEVERRRWVSHVSSHS
jgi:hypothetical protein